MHAKYNIASQDCMNLKISSSPDRLAVEVLKKGGIVAHATDTCYGLAASINSKRGIRRLYEMKQMEESKPVSILVSDIAQAKKYGEWNDLAERLAGKYWPGQLTIVLKKTKAVPPFLNEGTDTIGIRVPNHKESLEIIRKLGCPITTTSANISGEATPYTVTEVVAQFIGEELQPDFILHGGDLDETKLPSAVVDCSEGKIFVIRNGGINLTSATALSRNRKKRPPIQML